MYSKEEKLSVFARIAVTQEVHRLLKREKKLSKFSMSKIICNLVLATLGKEQGTSENTSG